MRRREFLKAAGFYAGITLAGCTATRMSGGRPRRPGKKPNIIFIMADDLGYGDLGCYGQRLIETPNVDQMAMEGMRFTQCYAGGAVCAPSRSVLMTGQHLGHTRVRKNKCRTGGVPDEMTGHGCRPPLLPEDVTVAEVLKSAGYATGITGKWGLGDPGTTGEPNKQGFDEWFGYLNQNHAVFYYTDYLWHNGKKVTLHGNLDGKKQQYTHDLFTGFALRFISRHSHEPFFLYVPFTIPHFNIEVPDTEPYTDKPWPEKAKKFAAMITRMDNSVGLILGLLKDLHIDDNTIVFFCSDNGASKSGGPIFNSGGPLKGGKGGFNEGGIRTPMVVRWPGKVPAATLSDTPWYFADVLPTAAELAGAKTPDNIDGASILPSLLGKHQDLSGRFMYWESPPPKLSQTVRWGNYKAMRRKPNAPLELYDLAADLREQHNIADEHPDIIAVFEEYLKTARTESAYWPGD